MIVVNRGAPRISVITAVYNAEHFLANTLRSLLGQTYEDFEAVVIDDGSSDASLEIVERFAADDDRIRVFSQANSGVAGALNRGLRESRGEFIAFLDHDDLWKPEKLALQLDCFERDESLGFAGCYSALVNPDGHCLGWRFGSAASGDVYRKMLFCDLVGGGSVAMVRRAAFDQAGLFDPRPEIRGRSDWDQWIRIARSCTFATVEKTLVGYTRGASNYSRDYRQMVRAGAAVLAKAALGDPDLDTRTLVRARARDTFGIFCMAFADGEFGSASGLLRQSISFSWRPLMFSPRRLLVVALFLVAKITPRARFEALWRWVASAVFGLTPGEPFLIDAGGSPNNRVR
ncbi:glycosyltransferase family A protein [uncultured Gimesia sp.]|uniref:glycosyltransferase family 2 protein n=1 Tax=uncultured Gimesia sp. TaxID=1678688 RepID=UPI0026110BC1|nr:glycosyltransferase family A protein [uncultured Gimesia sp.]